MRLNFSISASRTDNGFRSLCGACVKCRWRWRGSGWRASGSIATKRGQGTAAHRLGNEDRPSSE